MNEHTNDQQEAAKAMAKEICSKISDAFTDAWEERGLCTFFGVAEMVRFEHRLAKLIAFEDVFDPTPLMQRKFSKDRRKGGEK